jgi:hypothetical protein
MSAIHPQAGGAWLRLRLSIAEPRGGPRSGSMPAAGTELPTEDASEEPMRRIRRPRAEPDALASNVPARRTADLAGRDLVESLARGVGGSITPDGLEWLLRRHHPSPVTPAAALQVPPPPSPGSEAFEPASGPSPTVPASRPRPPAQTQHPAADGRPLTVEGPALRAEDELRRGQAGPSAGSAEVRGASSTERHSLEPATPDRASPKPAKRTRCRSTIAVDPLDAPLDTRHARVAAAALIHDLEVGRIELPQ